MQSVNPAKKVTDGIDEPVAADRRAIRLLLVDQDLAVSACVCMMGVLGKGSSRILT
jgi:hypothetical protein